MNGKLSEPAAAMGVIQLKYLNENIKRRKLIFDRYSKGLSKIYNIRQIKLSKEIDYNYAYYPIFFREGFKRRELIFSILEEKNIFCRRYWYPLITDSKPYKNYQKSNLKNAKELSESVLCLPIFYDLSINIVDEIINVIEENLNIQV